MRVASPPGVIDLGIGEPDVSLAPAAELERAARHRLTSTDRSWFPYAPEQGSMSFREQLAALLTRHYGTPVAPQNLLVTAGATHGLDLVLTRLAAPGDIVFVEDPTYFFALDVLADRHVEVVAIPTDAGGLDLDALEQGLRRWVPALLYTIPIFHNPTGTTLPRRRRERLIELAEAYGFLVVADEVYQLVGPPSRLPQPLGTMHSDRVLSLGSFSKILGPGTRLGWIQAAPEHLSRLAAAGVLRSGGGANPVMAAIVESAIALGIQDDLLARLRRVYDARRRHMIEELDRVLDERVHFTRPEGGFYTWLTLPPGSDAATLAQRAAAHGVSFRPGRVFSASGGFGNCLRLCFTYYNEQTLSIACDRLGEVVGR